MGNKVNEYRLGEFFVDLAALPGAHCRQEVGKKTPMWCMPGPMITMLIHAEPIRATSARIIRNQSSAVM